MECSSNGILFEASSLENNSREEVVSLVLAKIDLLLTSASGNRAVYRIINETRESGEGDALEILADLEVCKQLIELAINRAWSIFFRLNLTSEDRLSRTDKKIIKYSMDTPPNTIKSGPNSLTTQ